MKGCLIALGIPVGLVILVIGLFWLNYYDVHVRYRLTVEVQDGDQVKTGSSVIEVLYDIQPTWSWSGPNNYTRVVGYAPTVDLGEKGMLFLTFVNATRTPDQRQARNRQFFCAANDMWCLAFAAYGIRAPTGIGPAFAERKPAPDKLLRQMGPRDVPFDMLPALETFRDTDGRHFYLNPRPENLAATFGAGVELKRVVLQLTDDPVTSMPNIWPQWLKQAGQEEGTLKGYRED
jgi:hypothetical protein